MSVDPSNHLAGFTPTERSLFELADRFLTSAERAGRPVRAGMVVIVGARASVESILSVEIMGGTRVVALATAAVFAKRVETFGRACPCPDTDACGRRARCEAIAAQVRADAGEIQVALVDDGHVSLITLGPLDAGADVNAPGGAA